MTIEKTKQEKLDQIAKIELLKNEMGSMENEIVAQKQLYAKIKTEPDKYSKHVEVLASTHNMQQQDMQKLNVESTALDNELEMHKKSQKVPPSREGVRPRHTDAHGDGRLWRVRCSTWRRSG